MIVRVESCWGGGDRFYFRLTLPDGRREIVTGDRWSRKLATIALDLLELHAIPRRSVRFSHR